MSIAKYVPTEWENSRAPAINQTNLNKIERGIETVTDETIELRDNPTKAQETVLGVTKMWLTDNNETLNISTL